MPKQKLYYLQNETAGYVGNSPMFWHITNSGYTPNIAEAKKFTRQEAELIIKSTKGSHRFKKWSVNRVIDSAIWVADMQKLRESTNQKGA